MSAEFSLSTQQPAAGLLCHHSPLVLTPVGRWRQQHAIHLRAAGCSSSHTHSVILKLPTAPLLWVSSFWTCSHQPAGRSMVNHTSSILHFMCCWEPARSSGSSLVTGQCHYIRHRCPAWQLPWISVLTGDLCGLCGAVFDLGDAQCIGSNQWLQVMYGDWVCCCRHQCLCMGVIAVPHWHAGACLPVSMAVAINHAHFVVFIPTHFMKVACLVLSTYTGLSTYTRQAST